MFIKKKEGGTSSNQISTRELEKQQIFNKTRKWRETQELNK